MRIEEIEKIVRRHRLDAVVIRDAANIRALTGIECDNAILYTAASSRAGFETVFFTDFRYIPMAHRVAPDLKVRDLRKFELGGKRIGYESSLTKAQFDALVKLAPRRTKFIDVAADLAAVRAVKTPAEIASLRAAEKLVCEIWRDASRAFRAGMTEREMARIIKVMMIERGDGEAFATIVCVGRNAAECHHEPDDTVWDGKEPVLVDIGVKLDGYCSDLTRNVLPRRMSVSYRRAYALVKKAHDAAIAAAKPGMTARALDAVARKVIRDGGFGKCFGHSLGHGVGLEIHEAPTVSKKCETVLEPGMTVTIEPGIYLEDNLGVRIEDLILITENGCEVLSDAEIPEVRDV